jgi:Methyltransferase domain
MAIHRTDTTCPICERTSKLLGHSVVAPFLTSLSRLNLGLPSSYCECEACDFGFFDFRYGDAEMSLLYGGYRGEEYLSLRHQWEPWYSPKVNDAYSEGSTMVDDRRTFMTSILRKAALPSNIMCAVDFGGDEGQFFPEIPIERRIVCDVSNRELPPGIQRISALSELQDTKADLVIIAHVLEHLPNPTEPLAAIREVIADDGILYVEVPLDRFQTHPSHSRPRYQRYLQRIIETKWLFILLDFVTGVSRQYRSTIPKFGIIKQSEHINYFSRRSLHELLAQAGFRVVAERSDSRAKVGGLRLGRFGVAARALEDDRSNGASQLIVDT